MSFMKKPVVFFAVIFALIPSFGFAQYVYEVDPFWSYFKDPGRWEIGGGLAMASGEFAGVSRVITPGYIGDTTSTRAITSTGFGAHIGLSIPIKGTGHISCWAVAAQLMVNQFIWSDLNQTYGVDGSYKSATTSVSALTQQISLPIGIDYKVGNDAILTKRLALGTSLGVGVIPQVNITELESIKGFDGGTKFGLTPYAKVEGAFFIGLCVKVRAMYTFGNQWLLDVNRPIAPGLTDGPFNISMKSNLMVSLIIMPFSGKWDEWAWYNTYDTYNQHDRLN